MTEGIEDETEIADTTDRCDQGHQRYSQGDPQAVFTGRKDPHCFCGLRGEETIDELCRIEGIAQSIYHKWSKEFMKAGQRRLAGNTARAASTGEVTALRREARELKEVVAGQTLELRLLKKA